MTFSLFDAHAHIAAVADPPPAGGGHAGDAFPVIGRLLCGVGPADWSAVASSSRGWPGTVPAFGLHPWFIAAAGDGWPETLERLLKDNPDAWLGESGLDGQTSRFVGMETQMRWLREQLRIAKRLRRPVSLHCVRAWDELLGALDSDYLDAAGSSPGIIAHSFRGSDEHLRKLVERGVFFSAGPLPSRSASRRDERLAARLPAERLLLESDHFLAPGQDAGERLLHALNRLAAARNMDAADLGPAVAANAARLFHHV